MRKLIFLIGFLLISNLAVYAGDWQVINISQTPKLIREKDNKIFYVAGYELHVIDNNLDSLLYDFSPLTVVGLYIADSSAIIAANDYYSHVSNKVLYRYIFKTGQLREFVSPEGSDVDGLVEWRQKPLVIAHHSTGPNYQSDTYFIQIVNSEDVLDTLFTFHGNFLFLNMASDNDKIIVEGLIPTPVSADIRHFTCAWNAQENKFDLQYSYYDHSKITFSLNDKEVFLTDNREQHDQTKTINFNWGRFDYYSAVYFNWSDSVKLEKGTDFNAIGCLRLDKDVTWKSSILLVGPVALDKDGNLTSVRIFSPKEEIFKNEGEGLDDICCLYYNQPAEGVYKVFLGSNHKIYYKKYLYTIPDDIKKDNCDYNNRRYKLNQNYPNPFNPSTTINFSVPISGLVTLKVYDTLGREVMALVNEEKSAGDYSVDFNGSNLSSGMYIGQMKAGKYTSTIKMILLK